MLPGEDYLAEQIEVIDVDGIHRARRFVKCALADALQNSFADVYRSLNRAEPYDHAASSVARRSLKNLCLSYLVETPQGDQLAKQQLAGSNNMTDTLAALSALVYSGSASADAALAAFEASWRLDPLVMDKWFSLQATRPGEDSVELVAALMENPAFSLNNPNKVRSLIGAFATANPTGFHAVSGAGYRFVADRVIELNRLNPQTAARIVVAFNRWKRYDPVRQDMMRAELKRIAAEDNLSSDVAEIVGNTLGQGGA